MDMKKINMVNDAAVERVIALRKLFNETLTNQTSTKKRGFFYLYASNFKNNFDKQKSNFRRMYNNS